MSSPPLVWPAIRVVPFSTEECPVTSGNGPPLFTWKDFYRFRNSLLRVLSPYGTVGPEGELPILESWELSKIAWEPGTSKPEFFVVSDMHNERFRWIRVEASPRLMNANLLTELVASLLDWPGWCIFLALTQGGLTVFSNRILYEGPLFEGSATLEEIADRCASTAPRVQADQL